MGKAFQENILLTSASVLDLWDRGAMLCSLNEAMECTLMGIPFSGTPLASQMLKQLK